jgi:hypothetical protein
MRLLPRGMAWPFWMQMLAFGLTLALSLIFVGVDEIPCKFPAHRTDFP